MSPNTLLPHPRLGGLKSMCTKRVTGDDKSTLGTQQQDEIDAKTKPPIIQQSQSTIRLPTTPQKPSNLHNLSAKSDTNAITNWAVMRNTISRVSEHTGTRGSRWSAMALEATRIRARKRESVRTEWIPIDLAEVIADLAGASVRILELQNRLLDLSGHLAYLD